MLPATAAAAAAVLLLGGAAAVAQYSEVTCTQNLWTLNSQGETPCVLWSALSSFCRSPFLVPPLKRPGDKYLPPSPSSSTDDSCHCNVVAFNLASACTICQAGFSNSSLLQESEWREKCTSYNGTGTGGFPGDGSLDLPDWAFMRDNGGLFQATSAQQLAAAAANISVTLSGSPTSTSSGALGISTSTSTQQTSQAPEPQAQSHKKSNTGAIAGGVVGGLALVALAAVLLWRYRSYVRSRPALVPPREESPKEYGLPRDMKVQYFVPPPPSSGHTSVDNLPPRAGGAAAAHPYAAGYAVQRNMPAVSPDPARSYTSSSNYSPPATAMLAGHSIMPFDDAYDGNGGGGSGGGHPYANPVVQDDYERTAPETPLPLSAPVSPWAEMMADRDRDRDRDAPTPAPARPLPPLRVPQPVRHSSTSTADFSASSWNSNTPLVQQQQQHPQQQQAAQPQQQQHHGSIDRILSRAHHGKAPRQPVPAPSDWVIE